MMSVRCRQGDRDVLFVKGAPESVLACCTHVRAPTHARLGHDTHRMMTRKFGRLENIRPSLSGPFCWEAPPDVKAGSSTAC